MVPFDRLCMVFCYCPIVTARKMHRLWNIRLQICRDLETRVRGHSKSLTHRSATYDFLLTFHSNHRPISYCFRETAISFKNRNFFPPPCILCAAEGVPIGIGYRRWESKARMMGLPGRERSLTISSAVWMQSTVTQTDGRTPGDSKDRA